MPITEDQFQDYISQIRRTKEPFFEHEGSCWEVLQVGESSRLSLGVKIRAVEQLNGEHLCTPTLWTVSDGVGWCGWEVPRGSRLDVWKREGESLEYEALLELLVPLAQQLAQAHRRGFIHGAIFEETIYFCTKNQSLTASHTSTWLLAPRLNGVVGCTAKSANHLPSELLSGDLTKIVPQTDIALLAGLIVRLQSDVYVNLQDPKTWGNIPEFAISTLQNALDPDYRRRPESMSRFIASIFPNDRGAEHENEGIFKTPNHFLVVKSDEYITLRYAKCHNIEKFENKRLGLGVKALLETHQRGNKYKEWRFFFYQSVVPDLFDTLTQTPTNTTLHLLNAKVVKNASGELFLSADGSTLLVLEPSWPVSVTDTISSMGCVRRHFVDLLDSGAPNIYLVKGILLHNLMGDLATNPDTSFHDAWESYYPKLRILAAAAGLTHRNVEAMRKDCEQHFHTITHLLQRSMPGSQPQMQSSPSEQGTPFEVEVNRYSSFLGMEGRIDVMRHIPTSKSSPSKMQLLELKSGGIRAEHFDQVQCYQLMWDTYSKENEIELNSALLYSRQESFQGVELNQKRIRKILHSRNDVVLAHHSLSHDAGKKIPNFGDQPLACQSCGFRRPRCEEQSRYLPRLGEMLEEGLEPLVEKKHLYFNHLQRLIEIEHWDETFQLGEIFSAHKLRYRVLERMAVVEQEIERVQGDVIFFNGANDRIFTVGDLVVAHQKEAESDYILRGEILELTPDSITLQLSSQPSGPALKPDGWIIERLPARIGHRANMRALYQFIRGASDEKFSTIVDRKKPPKNNNLWDAPNPPPFPRLNHRQQEAACAILSAEPITLVQGPPGTGKSTLITEVAKELLRRRKRILISAHTNTAIDTLLEKLVGAGVVDFMRIGATKRSPRVAEALTAVGVDAGAHFSEDIEEDTEDVQILREKICAFPIIAATTFRCAAHPVFDIVRQGVKGTPFHLAIIDEATQIPEPMTLAPYALAEKLVLVGDHKQLPPIVSAERAHSIFYESPYRSQNEGVGAELNDIDVVASMEKKDNSPQMSLLDDIDLDDIDAEESVAWQRWESRESTLLEEMRLAGLDRSMFERLVLMGHQPILLNTQYRMHRSMMAFSNRAVYAQQIVEDQSTHLQQLPLTEEILKSKSGLEKVILSSQHVVFIDVLAEESGNTNRLEGEVAHKVVELLTKNHPSATIGVISPYRAQVRMIRHLLDQPEEDDDVAGVITVDTVERFQGAERDVIVVSFVRTSRPTDFLCDIRRLNVTLTRARKKLILIGNKNCLSKSSMIRQLIEQPETHYFEFQEQKDTERSAPLPEKSSYA